MNRYKEAIIEFEKVRDLPFHISINGEPDLCCEGKSKMLVERLNDLNVFARLRIGFLKWGMVNLPKSVTDFSHDERCSHFFVEVKNSDNEWIFIDPTWNEGLKKAGFEIAKWDGVNSTCLAFECEDILSPEESIEYIKKIDYETDLLKNGKFYEALNQYCDSFLN